MGSSLLSVIRTAVAIAVVFGLAGPVLAIKTLSPSPTKLPGFHFARSQPGVRESYIVSFGLFGGQSVFESEARGAAQILSEKLPQGSVAGQLQYQEGWRSNAAQPSGCPQSGWRGDGS
jgi:hypothetical protein